MGMDLVDGVVVVVLVVTVCGDEDFFLECLKSDVTDRQTDIQTDKQTLRVERTE